MSKVRLVDRSGRAQVLSRRCMLLLGLSVMATPPALFDAVPAKSAEPMTRVIVTLRNANRDREVQDLFNGLSGLEYRLVEADPNGPVLILDVGGKAMRRLRELPMVVQIAAQGVTPVPKGETPAPRPDKPPAQRPGPQLNLYIVQYDGIPRREIRRIRRAMDGLPFRVARQMDASRMIVVETNARGYRRLQRIEGLRVWRDGLSAPL